MRAARSSACCEPDVTSTCSGAHRTPRESVRAATEKFLQSRIRPAGTVLNGLDLDAHGYRAYRYYGTRDPDAADPDERTRAAG